MIYLVFNEGYSASGGEAHARAPLVRRGDPARAAFAAPLPRRAGDHGAARAARAAARARGGALRRERLASCCSMTRTARGGTAPRSRRGSRSSTRRCAIAAAGPTRSRRRSRRCMRAPRSPRTPTGRRSISSTPRWRSVQPSPVVTLNRAVAVSKVHGAEAALAMIEPLASRLAGYFHFHGLRGALLQTARTRAGSARRLRPRHRAREFAGRGRPHPHAPRPPDAGKRRRHNGRQGSQDNLATGVGCGGQRPS